ncbi:MAG: DNA repair protein RecN [Clostridia bacterium]|nr:DNA repair protein RecN [Clostridia bacterium]
MLIEMEVANYALIDRMRVKLGHGFNVLTGETGAGKSLVIDCLGLALGGRASADSVRVGEESATVEAVFDVSGLSGVENALAEQGIEPEPDGTMVVFREVSRQGRSRCRVNGRIVTQTALAGIGEQLVDIYGQQDYQSLVVPRRHRALLDSFGGAELREALRQYRSLYDEWRAREGELMALRALARERAQRADILSFQAGEIEAARLQPGEDCILAAERTVLANAEKLRQAVDRAYELVYESSSPDSNAAADMLGDALSELDYAARIDPSLASARDAVANMCELAADAGRAMRSYRDSVDFSPDRLCEVEERLAAIARLKRKYGDSLADVMEYGASARAELAGISTADERAFELEAAVEDIAVKLGVAAEKLSRLRATAAVQLERDVSLELTGLSMPSAVFRVAMRGNNAGSPLLLNGAQCCAGPDGIDDVEFMFSANRGEDPRPLAKIASGGEMSRVMLAIKSVLAEADAMPTMVFDEVDQGIGGEASMAVAARLAAIGSVRQVLAVTHLPQIAAVAGIHFKVEKAETGGRTEVRLMQLDPEERVAETARMLGGENPSDLTLAHAREMLTLIPRLEGLNRGLLKS